VFHVSIWGAWSFVWGVEPTKAPRGDGTGQTTSGRLLLATETQPWNVTEVPNCSLCEPWWSRWDFTM